MQRESTANRGFTLLELIVVMAIIAIIVGMAVPTLHGFAEGRRTTTCADELVAAAKYARTQSIANGRIYRLYIQQGRGSSAKFWVGFQQDDGTYGRPRDSLFGNDVIVPDNVTLRWLKTPQQLQPQQQQQQPRQQQDGPYIEFQPTGRTDPAVLEIVGSNNYMIDIACFSATELYHVVTASDRAKGLI